MSILSRLRLFFSIKTDAVLNHLEDPRQVLEATCAHQQDLLRQVRRGLIDVATARQELRVRVETLRTRLPQLEAQARRALTAEREDLARLALQRKQACLAELGNLEAQLAEVAEEEQKLTVAEQQYALQVDRLRTRRDTLTATYTAAEAQVRAQETLSNVSLESADWGQALERAETKIQRMRSRASALDALLAAGTLATPGQDQLEQELQQLSARQAVDDELRTLKAQLTPAPAAN